MEINFPEIISGNHVTDFSGNPNKINSTNKKTAGNIFGGVGTFRLILVICPARRAKPENC